MRYLRYLCLLTGVLLFMLFISGCLFIPKEQAALAPPLKTADEITYHTVEVRKGIFENKIEVFGKFLPVVSENLFFKDTWGYFDSYFVVPGQIVKAGDLIAKLDDSEIEKAIEQQKAELYKAELRYEQLKSSGRDDIEMARLQLADMKDKYERMKVLTDTISDNEIKSLERQIRIQEITLKKLIENYGVDENGIEGYSLRLAAADIQLARKRLDELRIQHEKTFLTSPIDGEVTYLARYSRGMFIDEGMHIATIAGMSGLQVEYNGNDAYLFPYGADVEVIVDNISYNGRVVMDIKNIPKEDRDKGNVYVRFEVEGSPPSVTPGKSARIVMKTEVRENVLIVPVNAVRTFIDEDYVYVLEDGVRVKKVVEVGSRSKTEAVILKGLEEGESVILN